MSVVIPSDPHVDLYRSRSHQSNCKWVPGWWDPICRVCQELKAIESSPCTCDGGGSIIHARNPRCTSG